MHYVVFGVGRQGAAAIFDLLDKCGATRVTAIDVDPHVRERIAEVLGDRTGQVELHALDPRRPEHQDEIVERIRGCACAISALPYALNPIATTLCHRAGAVLADLGGNPDVIAEQVRLCDGSTLIMPDCGLSPGLNNIMTVYLRRRFDVIAAKAYCGGIPATRERRNPLDYKLLFSPWGLISEYSGRCAVLRDGCVEHVEALTGHEELDGDREAFYTSNNSPLTFEYLRSIGLRNYEYKTVRWRGHLERILLLKQVGFFRGDEDLDAALALGLSKQDWLRFDRQRDVDEVVLRVEGWTEDRRATAVGITVRGTPMFSAMELTTSWGVTIPAAWVAFGATQSRAALPKGCRPPEQVVDPAWALAELERRCRVVREE
ncbi:MAG: hypothetical protein L6Q92_14455 [Phycisphaerae bacterium]|nr:hypothetical protein [Phycisphaerae bacterium]